MQRFLLPILLLAVVAVAGCTSTGQAPANPAAAAAPAEGTAAPEAAVSEAPLKEFALNSFYTIEGGQPHPQFDIRELTVNQGDRVRITVTNTKGAHTFEIDEYNIHQSTPLNEPVLIEFTADQAGDFVYYCASAGHRQNGHWGTLRVLAA